MKKFLLIVFIFSQSNFCDAQTAFNNSTSLNHSDLFGKTFLNSKAKKKINFISAYGLNFKISFHETDFFSNRYTPDSASCPTQSGLPYLLLHYRYSPSVQINYSLNLKLHFLNNKLFFETGVQLCNFQKLILKKVEGSHGIDTSIYCLRNFLDRSDIQKEVFSSRAIEFPFLIGVNLNFLQISIGTFSTYYDWLEIKDFYSSEIKKDKRRGRSNWNPALNPVINISTVILNKKLKLLPFISVKKFSFQKNLYFELGLELGYNFKEKK